MAITDADIKFLASQRLTDTADGGGRMTGVVVQDGVDNNVFDDVSSLDRVYGNVSLRKVFGAVLTPSTDKYLGARVIVDAAPADANVKAVLFSASSTNDTREQTRVKVESYLAPGAVYQGQLYGNHLAGQSSALLIQREAVALPSIGQVLLLRKNEGLADEFDQYTRIDSVSSVLATFTDGTGDFVRRIVTCGLAGSFEQAFPGFDALRMDAAISYTGKTRVFNTIVADAAQYYGIANLAQAGAVGDVNIKVDSIFTNLLPSAQAETPLVDLEIGTASAPLVLCSGSLAFTIAGAVIAVGGSLYLGQGLAPGSLTLTSSNATFADAGGVLMLGATAVGGVNYASGVVTFAAGAPVSTGTVTVAMKAAAAPSKVSDTASINVTLASRANNYNQTLYPTPMPGSLRISYRAQGLWYDLDEQGNGDIIGSDPSIGAGRLTFATGTASVTLGALPDVGSDIIYTWCAAADTINRSASTIPPLRIKRTLAHTGIAPSTFSVTWLAALVAKSATDNGSGLITGDATGTINYATGEVEMTPAVLPSLGATFDFAYQWGASTEELFPMPARGGDGSITVSLPLGGGAVLAKSVQLEFNLLIEAYEAVSLVPAEMQLAVNVDPIKRAKDNAGVFDSGVTGTINYTTGVINFMPDVTIGIPRARYSVVRIGFESYPVTGGPNLFRPVYRNVFTHWEYVPTGAFMPYDPSGYVKVRYRTTGSASAATESMTLGAMSFDLTDKYNERIVPGSARFTLGGKTYTDRLGTLVTDVLPNTGAATTAGTVDYATGAVSLTTWTAGQTATVALQALLTDIAAQPVDEVVFRIPAAPLRVGSVQIRYTPLTGGVQLVTADAAGVVSASGVVGIVNYLTGVVRVRFGEWVTAAGNETKPWYLADAVQSGYIFKPLPVDAATIRYNAVAYSYLPLDASILGLDPVRLPQDGRVPIFKKGRAVVVHNTQTLAPQTVANGQTVDTGRTRLARLRVKNNAGVLITTGFTVDLDAGTVTFSSIAGYAQPITIEHRIEDEALASEVQITGDMRLARALTHVFPLGATHVSSAMLVGTLQAASTESFSQLAWTAVWSDIRIGAPIVAQYNQAVYPIVVTNQGATAERWAFIFTSSTAFNIVGESAGVIGTGSVNTETAPINPATSLPFFTIPILGWGSGWAAGNVLRFNTKAANFPLWVARTTLQSPAAAPGTDQMTLSIRGDIDV